MKPVGVDPYIVLHLFPLEFSGTQVMAVLNEVRLVQDLPFHLLLQTLKFVPGALQACVKILGAGFG